MTEGIRRYERKQALNLLEFVQLGGDGVVYRGMARTLDMSEHGGLLETSVPLPPGERLRITLELEEDLVEVGAVSRHCHPSRDLYTAGVEFVDLTPAGIATIRRYMEALAAGE